MKKKLICAVAIALFLMVFVTAVHAEGQEFINEDEFETRFEEDPEGLIASIEANTTVVVPAPDDHECRFSLLCKKVKYENGQPVSGAEVTLVGSNYPIQIKNGGEWVDPPVTKTTNSWGCVCFCILWNHFPPDSIEVTIRVRKGDHEHEKTHMINGNNWHYWFIKIYNWIPPPDGVPELALTTPIVISIGAVAYFLFRRRREKQTYNSQKF